jgi:hypothetical protein
MNNDTTKTGENKLIFPVGKWTCTCPRATESAKKVNAQTCMENPIWGIDTLRLTGFILLGKAPCGARQRGRQQSIVLLWLSPHLGWPMMLSPSGLQNACASLAKLCQVQRKNCYDHARAHSTVLMALSDMPGIWSRPVHAAHMAVMQRCSCPCRRSWELFHSPIIGSATRSTLLAS